MKVAINFRGGAELERALGRLRSEVAGNIGLNATRDGARVLAKAAADHAPVGETGRLKKSIGVFEDRQTNLSGGRERTFFVGSRLYYAYWVEFGTVHFSPRGFLRKARDSAANDALKALVQSLINGINRVPGIRP